MSTYIHLSVEVLFQMATPTKAITPVKAEEELAEAYVAVGVLKDVIKRKEEEREKEIAFVNAKYDHIIQGHQKDLVICEQRAERFQQAVVKQLRLGRIMFTPEKEGDQCSGQCTMPSPSSVSGGPSMGLGEVSGSSVSEETVSGENMASAATVRKWLNFDSPKATVPDSTKSSYEQKRVGSGVKIEPARVGGNFKRVEVVMYNRAAGQEVKSATNNTEETSRKERGSTSVAAGKGGGDIEGDTGKGKEMKESGGEGMRMAEKEVQPSTSGTNMMAKKDVKLSTGNREQTRGRQETSAAVELVKEAGPRKGSEGAETGTKNVSAKPGVEADAGHCEAVAENDSATEDEILEYLECEDEVESSGMSVDDEDKVTTKDKKCRSQYAEPTNEAGGDQADGIYGRDYGFEECDGDDDDELLASVELCAEEEECNGQEDEFEGGEIERPMSGLKKVLLHGGKSAFTQVQRGQKGKECGVKVVAEKTSKGDEGNTSEEGTKPNEKAYSMDAAKGGSGKGKGKKVKKPGVNTSTVTKGAGDETHSDSAGAHLGKGNVREEKKATPPGKGNGRKEKKATPLVKEKKATSVVKGNVITESNARGKGRGKRSQADENIRRSCDPPAVRKSARVPAAKKAKLGD